jgi:hypothetical protein
MGPLDQVAYYIDGLKAATRMEVSYQAPETLEDAWKLAIRYDTAMFGLGKPQMKSNMSRKPQYTQRNRGPHPMELDQVETKKSYSSQQRRNPPSYEKRKITCYNCGKEGHIAKDCRSSSKAKVNQIESEEDTSSSSAEFVRLEENKEQLLHFNGKINGKSAWILLDSGASRNFINKKFARQHKLPQIETTTPFTVELADGRKKEVTSEVKIQKLELDEYKTTGISA